MFNFIRRHQMVALIFIAVVIVSFVITIGNHPDAGGIFRPGAQTGSFGTIGGKPITAEAFNNAQREINMYLRLRFGPDADRAVREMRLDVEREAYDRLLIQEKMREYNIEVPDEAVRLWIHQTLADPQTGQLNVPVIREAIRPMNEQDLARLARTELGRQRLMALIGVSGSMVTRQEAEAVYRRQNRPARTEIVLFKAEDYRDQVEITDEALDEYFRRNVSAYWQTEQRKISYVRFDAEDYLEEGESDMLQRFPNYEEEFRKTYALQDPELFTDDEGNVLSEEEAIAQMKESRVAQHALVAAHRAANRLIEQVMDAHALKPSPQIVEETASAQNLNVEITPPFDTRTEPEGLALPFEVRRAAFSALNRDRPYTASAVVAHSDNAVFVLGLHEIVPGRSRSLEEVRDQVVEDFRRAEAVRLAREAGEEFRRSLADALAEGADFASVKNEREIESIPLTFSKATRSLPELERRQINVNAVQNAAGDLRSGEASDFVSSASGGFVLLMHGYSEVDEERMTEELPGFVAGLRQQRQFAAFAEWLERERQTVLVPQRPDPAEEAAAR